MKTIIIHFDPESGNINAENLVNGNPDPEVLRLFGTHILPTPYTNPTRLEYVQYQIQHLNPDANVYIA